MKVKMGKEKVQICQANEDWCNQPNGRGFVSFVKVILEKLNDGALIESLKRKLRSHSERKKLNVEADQISCFYSNGMTFGTIKAKRSTKVSGSITTTAEINYLTKSAASFEMSGGGGDRVPVDITNAFGAIGKQKGSSEAAQIAYIDSGANRHFVNRIVKLDDERKSNTLMMDATGRMNRLDSDGELTIGVVDENGKAIDPIIITASRNNSSPMNLLSVSKLCKQGMSFHFAEYDSYFMYKGKRFTLVEENGMYVIRLNELLKAEELTDICSSPGVADGEMLALAATYDLWHERFGHASKQRLKFMYDNGMVEGLDVGGKHKHDKKCKCANCLSINNAKVHIGDTRKFADEVTQRGELVYTDLAGPYPADVHGYRYVIAFTDTYSRYSTCYFLKRKSEAENAFKAYLSLCKRDGVIVKRIRSDNGGEFGGHHDGEDRRQQLFGEGGSVEYIFDRVYRENEIIHELTPHDRPELNGLAERWNQTVIGMANAMLFSARISHVLWTSAVAHANTIRNRLPNKSLGKYTPYELWYHKRPRVDQLKVFGCFCYKLLPKFPKVPGQQARELLIYVGETADRLGFRVFNPRTYKFTTEFELIFDENSAAERGEVIRQWDLRRKLHAEGKLDSLPLIGNDLKDVRERDLDVERRIYQDQRYLEKEDEKGELHAPVVLKHEVFNNADSAPRRALDEKEAEAKLPSLLAEPHVEMKDRENSNDATSKEITRTADGTSQLTARNSPIHPDQLSGSRVGDSNWAPQSEELATLRNAPLLTRTRDSKGTVDGQPVDAYPHQARERWSEGFPKERAGADQLARADQVGPLTPMVIEEERKLAQFDPRHPRRPLRRLPVGEEEKDSDDDKEFRKFALDENLMVQMVDNPKRKGKDSWRRYNLYQNASTLREIIELSVTARKAVDRAKQKRKAMEDIKYDYLHGYILFPQHECNSSSHFVNAGSIALMANVVHVHQLFSAEEMDAARKKGEKEKATEAMRMIEERCKQIRLQEACAFVSFHTQIASLWDVDLNLQNYNFLHLQETSVGAALVNTLITDVAEPKSFKDIASMVDKIEWYDSVNLERTTLESRGTWLLVKRKSIGKTKTIKCKYVFKVKRNKNNKLQRKTRLVAQGFTQIAGVNYHLDQTYAGVVSYSSMRFLFAQAVAKGMILTQTDISAAYLESYLDEDIYMEVPPDLWVNGKPPVDEDGDEVVCKLQRGLYGLKQSGHLWSQCFKEFMLKDLGFEELSSEPNLYRKVFKLDDGVEQELLVGTYVDDCVIGASSEAARQWYLSRLSKRFPVNEKSTGIISFEEPGRILSMQVKYDIVKGILEFNQMEAIEALAKKFGVEKRKPRSLPIDPNIDLPKLKTAEVNTTDYMSIIGSCLHIAQVSRPDISYAMGVLSRHSATPGVQHMEAALDLVSYLLKTKHLFIGYRRDKDDLNKPVVYEKSQWAGDIKPTPKKLSIEERLVASTPTPMSNSPDMYCDADYAGDKETRRSTSGMIVMMNGGPISWSSRLQKLVALSSAESEIYAVADSVKEALHVKLMCEDCGLREPGEPMTVWEDNAAAIHLGHGLRGNNKQKHFAVRLRFLWEHIQCKNIEFAKIDTKEQLADAFTKQLPGPAFLNFRNKVLKSNKGHQNSIRVD